VRKSSSSANPLEPVASAVGCATSLLIVVILLSLLVHQASWGNGPVCASLEANLGGLAYGKVSVLGLTAGSKASLTSVAICSDNPTAALRLAGLLAAWPYTILWGIFLFRMRGLLKAASQPGELYSAATAAQLRGLGWLMTGGGVVAGIIGSSARVFIFTRLVHYPGIGWFEPGQFDFSFWILIVGLVLITVARVMRLGVTMREELDVTV
jgi:hypothetical protein